MNREQMEAWCALEGLHLYEFLDEFVERYRYRLARPTDMAYSADMLSYSGYWHYASMGDPERYVPISWARLPDRAFAELLGIDVLTELAKK